MIRRRWLLACAAPVGWLAACSDPGPWPAGMQAIKWDRDRCHRCGMAVSDRRFAAQVRGGPRDTALVFDDIGCAATFCAEKGAEQAWLADPATRWWVAEFEGKGERWLDARTAHYGSGPHSPMGYDFSAHAQAAPERVGFAAMAARLVAAWPANCRPAGRTT